MPVFLHHIFNTRKPEVEFILNNWRKKIGYIFATAFKVAMYFVMYDI